MEADLERLAVLEIAQVLLAHEQALPRLESCQGCHFDLPWNALSNHTYYITYGQLTPLQSPSALIKLKRNDHKKGSDKAWRARLTTLTVLVGNQISSEALYQIYQPMADNNSGAEVVVEEQVVMTPQEQQYIQLREQLMQEREMSKRHRVESQLEKQKLISISEDMFKKKEAQQAEIRKLQEVIAGKDEEIRQIKAAEMREHKNNMIEADLIENLKMQMAMSEEANSEKDLKIAKLQEINKKLTVQLEKLMGNANEDIQVKNRVIEDLNEQLRLKTVEYDLEIKGIKEEWKEELWMADVRNKERQRESEEQIFELKETILARQREMEKRQKQSELLLKAKQQELVLKLREKGEEIRLLRTTLEAEAIAITNELKIKQAELESKDKQIHAYKEKIEELKRQVQGGNREVAKLREEILALNQKVQNTLRVYKEQKERADRLQLQLDEMALANASEMEALKIKFVEQQEQDRLEQARIMELEANKNELQRSFVAMEDTNKLLEGDLVSKTRHYEQLMEKCTALEVECQELKILLQQQQQKTHQGEVEIFEQTEQLQLRRIELENVGGKVVRLEEELARRDEQLALTQLDLKAALDKLQLMEDDLRHRGQEMGEKTVEMARLLGAVKQLEERVIKQSQNNIKLNNIRTKLTEDVLSLNKKLQNYVKAFKDEKARADQLKIDIIALEAAQLQERECAGQKIEEMEGKMKELTLMFEGQLLEKDRTDGEAIIVLKESIKNLEARVLELQLIIKEKEAAIDGMRVGAQLRERQVAAAVALLEDKIKVLEAGHLEQQSSLNLARQQLNTKIEKMELLRISFAEKETAIMTENQQTQDKFRALVESVAIISQECQTQQLQRAEQQQRLSEERLELASKIQLLEQANAALQVGANQRRDQIELEWAEKQAAVRLQLQVTIDNQAQDQVLLREQVASLERECSALKSRLELREVDLCPENESPMKPRVEVVAVQEEVIVE